MLGIMGLRFVEGRRWRGFRGGFEVWKVRTGEEVGVWMWWMIWYVLFYRRETSAGLACWIAVDESYQLHLLACVQGNPS